VGLGEVDAGGSDDGSAVGVVAMGVGADPEGEAVSEGGGDELAEGVLELAAVPEAVGDWDDEAVSDVDSEGDSEGENDCEGVEDKDGDSLGESLRLGDSLGVVLADGVRLWDSDGV
jgi:hypothetical protein